MFLGRCHLILCIDTSFRNLFKSKVRLMFLLQDTIGHSGDYFTEKKEYVK